MWEENILTGEAQAKIYVTLKTSRKVIGWTFVANMGVCIISVNFNKTAAFTSM